MPSSPHEVPSSPPSRKDPPHRRLLRCPEGGERLYLKKDRSLTVRVTEEGVTLAEDGFVKEETFFPAEEKSGIKKALKEAFAREFPRSHRVYCS